MKNDELVQARLAVNLIAVILSATDNEGVMAYAGNLAAALRDIYGAEFIDWEHVAATCDRREYALSQGRSGDDLISANDFASIVNRIQARCGIEVTEVLEDFYEI